MTSAARPAPKAQAAEGPFSSPVAAMKRAKDLQKAGDYARAIDVLSGAVKTFPTNQDLYVEHASCCMHERRLNDALLDSDTALKKCAPSVVLYRQRAMINFMLHDYQSAVKDFEQEAKLGSLTGNDYITLANCYASLGNTKATLENIALGLKQDPKNADAYYLRAKTYKALKQNELATADFAKAMSLQK